VGREIDAERPVLDARLPNGSRVNAIIPPGSRRGTCLTIRKFSRNALSMEDLVRFGSLGPGMPDPAGRDHGVRTVARMESIIRQVSLASLGDRVIPRRLDRRGDMDNLFNVVMKVVSTLIGLLMVCMGGIWVLQGLNIAFLEGSFMAGDPQWAVYGAVLLVLGIGQVVWSVTRKR
jgi:hypothetical protein